MLHYKGNFILGKKKELKNKNLELTAELESCRMMIKDYHNTLDEVSKQLVSREEEILEKDGTIRTLRERIDVLFDGISKIKPGIGNGKPTRTSL